jgi:hypothetical protein
MLIIILNNSDLSPLHSYHNIWTNRNRQKHESPVIKKEVVSTNHYSTLNSDAGHP